MAPSTDQIMTLSVPRLPPGLNQWQRMHWIEKGKLQKVWDSEVLTAWTRRKPRRVRKFTGQVRVCVWLCFGTSKTRDPDNRIPKVILDALRHCDIIEDDDEAHCQVDVRAHASVSFVGTILAISPTSRGAIVV